MTSLLPVAIVSLIALSILAHKKLFVHDNPFVEAAENTGVHLNCSLCQYDFWLSPDDVEIRSYDNGGGSFCEFYCPMCGELTLKPCTPVQSELLISMGVPIRFMPVKSLPRRSSGGSAPAFHPDDLEELGRKILDTDWFAREFEKLDGSD